MNPFQIYLLTLLNGDRRQGMIFSLPQQIQLHNSTGKLTQVKEDNSAVFFEQVNLVIKESTKYREISNKGSNTINIKIIKVHHGFDKDQLSVALSIEKLVTLFSVRSKYFNSDVRSIKQLSEASIEKLVILFSVRFKYSNSDVRSIKQLFYFCVFAYFRSFRTSIISFCYSFSSSSYSSFSLYYILKAICSLSI